MLQNFLPLNFWCLVLWDPFLQHLVPEVPAGELSAVPSPLGPPARTGQDPCQLGYLHSLLDFSSACLVLGKDQIEEEVETDTVSGNRAMGVRWEKKVYRRMENGKNARKEKWMSYFS